ncbi:MAG TPA: hypothetical protein VGK78_18500, partial [Nocardioides sp.]|uniref:hypothetical protein n=1 Tax=Nocardioides sp. TaxID=35761 RepID=UPI002F3FA6B3
MIPRSPDPADGRRAIDAVLEPLRAETHRVDDELRDNEEFLAERRSCGIDPETRALLERAAGSPAAPESLRRVARLVAAGRVTWDDVFAHRGGPEGAAFLDDALRTARRQFAEADLPPAKVPDEALEVGIDPDEVSDDIFRARVEAQEDHDAIFRQ